MSLKLSFRKKIIIVVLCLATLPLLLFGMNALRIADRFHRSSERTKERLLESLKSQSEDYFIRLNQNLGFIERVEARDEGRIGSILFSALESIREMESVAYISGGEVDIILGDEKFSSMEERISSIIGESEEVRELTICDGFEKNANMYFNMYYPLDDSSEEALFMTFSLEELQRKLEANRVEDTGVFALVNESGSVFAGADDSSDRFRETEIGGYLKTSPGGKIDGSSEGYRFMGRRLEVLWPMWLVFTQERREAEALTGRLKTGTFIFLIVMLFFSAGISYVLASDFSRPISSMLEAVKKNYSGELKEKARLSKKDRGEMALLIKGFNKMIDGLREARHKLIEKEKMAAVGEMASVIGHDIRNPLSAIKNGVYFLNYAVETDNERVKKSLDIIDREIATISEIIENLLGYSRQRPPALEEVDVNALIDEAISIIDIPQNVRIIKEYSNQLGNYHLDRGEMKQVFVNIINNAVQACQDEGGEVRIKTLSEKTSGLQLRVKDTGVGIPRELLDKIFKAFYSTKKGGTGLGMSSVKNIVERHEGAINIRSKEGKGTEIIISIPLLKIEEKKAIKE